MRYQIFFSHRIRGIICPSDEGGRVKVLIEKSYPRYNQARV